MISLVTAIIRNYDEKKKIGEDLSCAERRLQGFKFTLGELLLQVDCRPTRPTADRHLVLWLWLSETTLRWTAAVRCITDAHAVSVTGS